MGRAADPTPHVRMGVYERDGHKCVSCGRWGGLTFQHRQAVGMGGSTVRPTFAQGLSACGICNGRYETDLQAAALRFGWKAPRWVQTPGMVPVFYTLERRWYRLTLVGTREHVVHAEAMRLMREVYGEQYVEGVGLVRD